MSRNSNFVAVGKDSATTIAPSSESIVAWLSALDFERTQAETYAQRVEGTSDWILHHPRFRSWLIGRSPSPVLWCHGLAGTGKTVGTSIVVNYLRRAVSGPRSAVAFIYCDEEAQPAQTAQALLSSLCAQLAAQRATQLPPLLLKLYQQMVALDADRRLDIDNVMLTAMALCDGAFDRVFVCVDALDEVVLAGERAILLQKLRWMWDRGVRIFITSQTHGDLPERCGCNKDIVVALQGCEHILVKALEEDIVSSVWARLQKHHDDGVKILARAGVWPAAVVERVVGDSGGMFLMAQLKMDRELQAALAAAEENPTLGPVAYVSSFASSETSLSDTSGVPMQYHVVESEGSVAVPGQDQAGQEDHPNVSSDARGQDIDVASDTSTIPTVISTRLRVIGGGSSSSQDEDEPGVMHLEDRMADLTIDTWWDGIDAIEEQESYLRRECAMTALSWVLHAKEPLRLDDLTLGLTIDMDSDLVRIWVDGHGIWIEGLDSELGRPEPALERQRLPENTVSLIDVCEGLISIDNQRRAVPTAPWSLGQATQARLFPHAHLRIAHACLEAWCDVFDGEETGWTTREGQGQAGLGHAGPGHAGLAKYAQEHWAAHLLACRDEVGDDYRVVEFLCKLHEAKPKVVEQRSSIRLRSGLVLVPVPVTDDETPVLKAARLGLNGVLGILLKRDDYPIDARSYKKETAISAALLAGYTSTVQLLLKHGASIHYRDEFGHSLLHMAAKQDDEAMVALVLEMGLDKNTLSSGRNGKTALYQAVEAKKIEAVRMLLKYGCDTSKDKGLLYTAINTGMMELVELLVEYGVDLKALESSASSTTLLFTAVRSGSLQLVEFMLRNGSSIQQLNSSHGSTVLHLNSGQSSVFHLAASRGDLDMVKLLFKYCDDAMIPYRESDGGHYTLNTTAVGDAIRDGGKNEDKRDELVDFLLARMPPDVPGPVILGMAVGALEKGLGDLAKRLILMVPEPLQQIRKDYKHSLMGISIVKDDVEFLALLLGRGLSPTAKEEDGWAPLYIAAVHDCAKAVALLMKHGADINVRDEYGLCPVHAAALNDSSRAMAVLLDHGADVNAQTKLGMSPLHIAAHQGLIATVRVLLDHRPDLTIQAADGSTPLMLSTRNLRYDVVQLLLEYNADISQPTFDGETALHFAAIDGVTSLVQTLLDRGISLSVQSRRGGTALHYASYTGETDIVKLLLKHGAEVDLPYDLPYECDAKLYPPVEPDIYRRVPWHQAARAPSKTHRTPPGDEIKAQWTALHTAACGGHVDVVEMLLAHGADVSAKGAKGETPLHVAASAAQSAAVELLVAKGADIGMTSAEGNTALHWAACAAVASAARKDTTKAKCCCMLDKEKQHQHLDHSKSDCVATLLKLGADPMVENEAGMSPLAVTLVAGHVDVVEALVAHSPPRTFTLSNMNNLTGVLQSQDKYEAAEQMYGRVLELREQVLSSEHPLTLSSMHNLAIMLDSQGKYEASEQMHRRALELKKQKENNRMASGLSNVKLVPEFYCNRFMETFTSWIECCDANHGTHCKPLKSTAKARPRLLIDVREGCLVPTESIGSHLQYMALSYVWGGVPAFRTVINNVRQLQKRGALYEASTRSQIPRTIQNAMDFVNNSQMPTWRYLWVDALCIIQDDEEFKHSELDRMGDIYQGAMLTIVAAEGNDANAGIRFGYSPFYGRPLTMYSKAQGSHPNFQHYRTLLKASTWGQRGWTFQELLCSRRLICFLPQGVLWECHCVNWWNNLNTEVNALHDEDEKHLSPPKYFHDQSLPNIQLYKDVVMDYNRRLLTQDDDVERAFAGVMSNLANVFGPFVFGHPVIAFDWTLLWQPDVGAKFRSTARAVGKPRREEVGGTVVTPSWSWLCMQGNLDLKYWDFAASRLDSRQRFENEIRPLVRWNIYKGPGDETPILGDINCFEDLSIPQGEISGEKRRLEKWKAYVSSERNRFRRHLRDFSITSLLSLGNTEEPVSDEVLSNSILSPLISCRSAPRGYFHLGDFIPAASTQGFPFEFSILANTQVSIGTLIAQHVTDPLVAGLMKGEACELIAISSVLQESSFQALDDSAGSPKPAEATQRVPISYNVLWIEWEEGIAYRRGLGTVSLAGWALWGIEEIDVILG